MDCQTNNLENSLPFHQSLGLIQLIFVNYFLLEARSHKVCFKAGNWKPVERKWFATAPTTVREVLWGFTWLQLNVPKALDRTSRFWQWNMKCRYRGRVFLISKTHFFCIKHLGSPSPTRPVAETPSPKRYRQTVLDPPLSTNRWKTNRVLGIPYVVDFEKICYS